MNSVFAKHASNVVELFHRLDDAIAHGFLDKFPPEPGVYLFLEDGTPGRIGRTNNLSQRLKNHLRQDHGSAAYAFKRARQKLGLKPTYRKGSGRKDLQKDPAFVEVFRAEIERLKTLSVKYVVVEDIAEQYLLEIYSAIEYGFALDEFGNH
ncbi:MAG: hypothetical protein E5Y30_30925 [Mesorhizobium sp.]|nr:MAG: hypothetical protein E5Y30_30925 [Mesorhizobium sp.]